MKFKFLRFPAFCLFLYCFPAPGSTISQAPDISKCQQRTKAVVTLYSGLEIGSGSIIDADGTILTARHVVEEAIANNKVTIYVKLKNDHRYTGQVLKEFVDKPNDLALVKIIEIEKYKSEENKENIVQLAEPAIPEENQTVCAIGSPSGRTSFLGPLGKFDKLLGNGDLQASGLKLTYGSSGGPLLNLDGELIGVNKSGLVSKRGENTGISFATGAQAVRRLIDKYLRTDSSFIAKQPAKPAVRPLLTSPVAAKRQLSKLSQAQAFNNSLGATFDPKTLTVEHVEPGSLAALSGLQPGDRVIKVDETQLSNLEQLQTFLSSQPTTMKLTIVDRNQQVRTLQVNF